VIGADVAYLVNYLRAVPASRPCLLDSFWCSADVNGDCQIIGSNATKLINYLRGIGSLCWCPDYESAWHDQSELPTEAPGCWPSCESSILNIKNNKGGLHIVKTQGF
jgi:hypothetical protein